MLWAVDVAEMDVNLASRCSTIRFWTTSSRVGQTHSACGFTLSYFHLGEAAPMSKRGA